MQYQEFIFTFFNIPKVPCIYALELTVVVNLAVRGCIAAEKACTPVHHFNSHVPGEPGYAGCPLSCIDRKMGLA